MIKEYQKHKRVDKFVKVIDKIGQLCKSTCNESKRLFQLNDLKSSILKKKYESLDKSFRWLNQFQHFSLTQFMISAV